MSSLLRGGVVLVMDDARTEVAADVRVRGNLIVDVAPDLAPEPGEVIIDARGAVVLPGFVQTHIHLCQTLFRNLADDLSLLGWLAQRIWPLEAAHTAASLRASAELGIAELLLGGTTAIVDMGTVRHTDQVFEALLEGGLRAVAGKCMMDDPSVPPGLAESTDDSLAESLTLASRWDGAGQGRIRYGFAPRFALSCTDRLMREVARLAAERGLFVHTHSSENVDEIALVEARAGMRNVAHLAALGIRGPRAVLAHCVHLDAHEVAELAAAGTRVSHCPSSNLKLGSGVCDVPGLVRGGVHVSLGADGAPCNNRLDMWTEMRTAALIQKPRHGPTAMPAGEVLAMATRRGAEAIGMGDRLGQVRPGFVADLQIVAPDGLLDGPGGAWASRLVYAADRHAVRHVMVDGELLVHDRRLVRWSRDDIVARAREELAGCVQRAGLAR
ncbi:MAG: 5'-deoxyadenosine deaminase [Deltaproteobacteria bacterium]|nr:5'-deoxyadenosine deaminase [Deltaproteobacteria bacterium]